MNKAKLLLLERDFLYRYPKGFNDEEMKLIRKKHNLPKQELYIHQVCSKENLEKGVFIFPDLIKVVSRSSMVSVFEKMKFRDVAKDFDKIEKLEFIDAIWELIHGNEKEGFEKLVGVLSFYKLAKWPLISLWRAYYFAQTDVFIKPTTVKKIILYIELEDIIYKPTPTYEFYKKYRTKFKQMKNVIKSKNLKPNNPAFSGFLMMTIQ